MIYTYYKNVGNNILIRYKDDNNNNNKTTSKVFKDYKPTLYTKKDGDSGWKSIFGYDLHPINFENIREAKNFAEQHKNIDNFIIEGNSNFANQFIIELLNGNSPAYDKNNIKRNFIDIEVSAPIFPNPDEAKWPVTAITCYNSADNIYYTSMLKNDSMADNWNWDQNKSPDDIKKLNINFKLFSEERDLLQHFLDHCQDYDYDIISGWNSKGFDIPYLVNRCYSIFGENYTKKKLSPFSNINSREEKNNFGKVFNFYEIIGLAHLDYMELYKKFTYTPRENYKLDFIAQEELEKKKLTYEESGSLENLYTDNPQLYIDYNIQDVNLIVELEEKLKLFDIVFSLTYLGLSNYEDVLGTVKFWEQYIAAYLFSQNKVPLFTKIKSPVKNIQGAYVREPKKGFWEWIFSVDLKSLYPHIIQQLNIGPDTVIDESLLPDEILELENSTSFEKILSKDADLGLLKEYDISMAPNYTYFKKDVISFLSAMMRHLYSMRSSVKEEMLNIQQKIVDEKDDSKINELMNKESSINNMQMAIKICLNSLYGALSEKSFLYYHADNAEAITTFGRLINQWTCSRLEKYLNELFKTDSESYWIYSDTDSGYFSLRNLVNQLPDDYSTEKKVNIIDNFINDILYPKIEQYCSELCDYLNNYEQRMFWEREVIADAGIWVGKKKYVLSVLNNEGVNYIGKNKYKITGMESVKSSTPAWSRKKLLDLYKLAFKQDESIIHNFVSKTRDFYDDLSIDDISIPRGTNDIESWIDDTGMPAKGCPRHVRGVITHNNFIKEKNLLRITEIKGGDHIKFIELKSPNIFRSPVISYSGYPPKEMDLEKYVDKDKVFAAAFEKPAQIFLDAIGWNLEKENTLF